MLTVRRLVVAAGAVVGSSGGGIGGVGIGVVVGKSSGGGKQGALRCRRALSTPAKKAGASAKTSGKGQPVGGEKKRKVVSGESNKATVEILQKFIDTAEKAKEIDMGFTEAELAEHQRIGLEYNKQSTARTNRRGSDLSTKIWLQQEAMRAMPAELRVHAATIDDTPPPPDRPWPIWMTPPIKGFNPRDYMGQKGEEEDDDDEGGGAPAAAKSSSSEGGAAAGAAAVAGSSAAAAAPTPAAGAGAGAGAAKKPATEAVKAKGKEAPAPTADADAAASKQPTKQKPPKAAVDKAVEPEKQP